MINQFKLMITVQEKQRKVHLFRPNRHIVSLIYLTTLRLSNIRHHIIRRSVAVLILDEWIVLLVTGATCMVDAKCTTFTLRTWMAYRFMTFGLLAKKVIWTF